MPPESPGSPAPLFSHPIDIRQFSWATPLARDYGGAYERLGAFFSGDPAQPASWPRALAARQAEGGPRREIAGIVEAQLAARDAAPEALAAARSLGAAGSVAVVTGQQAGLFGGPLFTLYKALTTIALARRVAAEHGVNAVPVFWVDAEDHDVDEVRTCTVFDRELSLHGIDLPVDPPAGRPVAAVRLPPGIGAQIDALRETLPDTEFSTATLEALATCYAPGTGLAEAFSRWLERLLGRHGLVVFDSSDPAAKPLARPVFEREIALRGSTARLAAAAGARLVERGYHAQVQPAADAVALFRLDCARRPIRLAGDGFNAGETAWSAAALAALARAEPHAFSPNVLLRPLVQDTLFPTVAYVSGPNELAYLAQLREVYAQFDVPLPLLYPRLSATLLDRAGVKFLGRHDLGLEQLQAQDDSVLNSLVSAQLPPEVDAAMEDLAQHAAGRLDAIAGLVTAIDPTLAGVARSTRQRVERDLGTLRTKVVQAAKRRDSTLRRQFQRARAQAFPDGAPQERVVAGIHFVNRYGFAALDRLLDDLPLDIGRHWLLTL